MPPSKTLSKKPVKKQLADLASAFDPKKLLSQQSNKPGVYQMFDSEGEILYVGKAKNLKKKIIQLFSKN